jgi:glycosyltransferase involved in cell wall biosynthesis
MRSLRMNTQSGISVVILTYNEECHIERCIRSVLDIATDIFVVDSYSTDATTAIAHTLGAKVYKNRVIST